MNARFGAELALAGLFDYLPDVYLYVKDRESRFIAANQSLWKMRGYESESEMLGKTDLDLHPRYLAERYMAEDRQVMESGTPLPNQIWLVPSQPGELKWFISSKMPLKSATGEIIGIAGVMRDLEKAKSAATSFDAFEKVVNFVLRNYEQPLRVNDLAAMVHLSVSQFDRRFKALYHMTPQQYILRVRLHAACHEILASGGTVAQIATRCGFYDQSYFSKQFRKHLGISPTDYRLRYQDSPGQLSDSLGLAPLLPS
ncbi:HTH-type transcriptional activator RhaS [Bremerella volcania]|uniref:HTH-type transcriptional activator RhaS n=1 Tax=Bremerella volcania TaxID=2527984 RepID=A0A518C920_9BACT|nr:AraC family transcriptional regulator [Bremerella volcania]QDU75710.1 HTH-type transcriptional activator RhaS [Bremerella volcania]